MKLFERILVAIGSCLFRVVAVDWDAQGRVTSICFSRDHRTLRNSASDILAGRVRIDLTR